FLSQFYTDSRALHSFPTRRSSDLMPDAEEHLASFKEKLEENESVYPISTITKEGITALLYEIADELEKIPKQVVEEEAVVIQPKVKEEAFVITREDDGAFVLTGDKIERLFKMTNFDSDEAVQRFARQMRQMGIDKALREKGASDGDVVRLLNYEFEFIE